MAPDTPPSTPPASEPSRCALIIDDEPTIRSALRRYFTRKGWLVEEAADGAGGLHMLSDHPERFDVVLCDLRMPGFSGIELHDELAQSNASLLRCFIFTTGDVASPEAAEFVARTRCHVLHKPFELRTLDGMIASMTASQERNGM